MLYTMSFWFLCSRASHILWFRKKLKVWKNHPWWCTKMIPLILQLTLVLVRIQDLVKFELQQMMLTCWKTMVCIVCIPCINAICFLLCSNFYWHFCVLSFQVQQPDMTQMKVAKKESQRKSCLCLGRRYVILISVIDFNFLEFFCSYFFTNLMIVYATLTSTCCGARDSYRE